MDLQVVSFAKRFSTARKCALVGVLACVQIHMGLESVSAVEFLAAAAEGAVKNLFLFLDPPSATLLRLVLLRITWRLVLLRITWRLLGWRAVSDHNLNFKDRSISSGGVVIEIRLSKAWVVSSIGAPLY